MKDEEQDYTIDQVARMVQVHRKTVENWILTGQLDAYQLTEGGRYRIRPEALKEFREKRQVKPKQKQGSKKEGDLALAS